MARLSFMHAFVITLCLSTAFAYPVYPDQLTDDIIRAVLVQTFKIDMMDSTACKDEGIPALKALMMLQQEGLILDSSLGGVQFQLYEEFVFKCNIFNSIAFYGGIKLLKIFWFGGKFPNESAWFTFGAVLGLINIAFEDMVEASVLVKDF